MPIDATNDPALRSWVESANDPQTDFPIQNLPLCAFEHAHADHSHAHLGVAIGDQILDIGTLVEAGFFDDGTDRGKAIQYALRASAWNWIGASRVAMAELRSRLQDFLRADRGGGQQLRRLRQKALRPSIDTKFLPPLQIGDYTDFYASKHHATNVGAMFRPDNPLLPNYKHIPIGYHGRTSSIVVSGTDIRRPWGQQAPAENEPGAGPGFAPSKLLDYELELGLFIGTGNELGQPIPIAQAAEHMLGVVILNDWSARDIQKWEYQPLGPFLAKNFASTISPMVVPMQALEPFRVPGPERDATDPAPLDYLHTTEEWGLDITLEVRLQSALMRERSMSPMLLSTSNFRRMFWTFAQMLAHHASNGCNLQTGDLLGSGTISGPEKSQRGCLLELTWDSATKSRTPIELPTGEKRTFLSDGDEVIMSAYAQREGFRRIGFGECRGRITGALSS